MSDVVLLSDPAKLNRCAFTQLETIFHVRARLRTRYKIRTQMQAACSSKIGSCCSHPTFDVLQHFKVAASSNSDDIDACGAKVTESLTSQDTQQKQQNLAVALQGRFLQELLEIVANNGLADSRLAAVLRICTLLMQSESVRDSFPTQVRVSW